MFSVICYDPRGWTSSWMQLFGVLPECLWCGCWLVWHFVELTFPEEVFKEPSGVVLGIFQVHVGSPPGSRSVIQILLITQTRQFFFFLEVKSNAVTVMFNFMIIFPSFFFFLSVDAPIGWEAFKFSKWTRENDFIFIWGNKFYLRRGIYLL